MAIEHTLTLEKSINEGVSLRKLQKEIGSPEIIKSISFLIDRLQRNSNVTNRMDAEQILMLSYDILEGFEYETIQDIILMLKMARKGVFGKTYNRLDSETVFTLFMPQYLDKKAEERENLHRKLKSKPVMNEANGFKQIYDRQIERNKELQKEIENEPTKRVITKEFAEEIKNRKEG